MAWGCERWACEGLNAPLSCGSGLWLVLGLDPHRLGLRFAGVGLSGSVTRCDLRLKGWRGLCAAVPFIVGATRAGAAEGHGRPAVMLIT